MTEDASTAVLDLVVDLLHREVGLRPEPSVRSRLRRCVREGAATEGLELEAYLASVMLGGDTMQGLLNQLTVQETSFFRHPEHFEVLARDLLPELRPPVNIWSEGCANGQEAFSLAMILDEQHIAGSVIATDLSTRALERTAAARYASREIGGLSPQRRDRYLTRTGDYWQVAKALQDRVVTGRHNLLDPIPAIARSSQVIFCRNVLIYISSSHTRAFLDRVADAYPAGTPLFLGAAEILWQLGDRFDVARVDETFFYRTRSKDPIKSTSAGFPPLMPEQHRASAHPAARKVDLSAPRLTAGARRLDVHRPPDVASTSPRALIAASREREAAAADGGSAASEFARAGQVATAAGDHHVAVVAFRACAFLCPDDAIAQLHLALALELAGDQFAARRAFAVVRRLLVDADPETVEQASDGYTVAELIKLLDVKEQTEPT